MVIFPTLSFASGTWTLTNEHEKMIRSTQRKMLRLIVQTKWEYKKETQNNKEGKEPENDKQSEDEKGDDEEGKEGRKNSEGDNQEGSSTDTDCDQGSDVSFAKDTDEEIDTADNGKTNSLNSSNRKKKKQQKVAT